MKLFHGSIITCDQENHQYQFLIEDKGRIVYVGDQLPEKYRKIKAVVELNDNALIPAFGDGHIHYSNWALIAGEYFDVRAAADFSDIGEIIGKYISETKTDKILVGFGISAHSLKEKRLISRKELDAIYDRKPLMIICYDGHSLVGNSKLIDLYPETIHKLRGFNLDTGQLFNEAYYQGLDFVTSKISLPKMIRAVLGGYDLLAAKGIGLIHTVEGIGFPRDMDVTLVSLIARARARRDNFQTRLFFQTMEVEKALKRKLPRIGGCFATALDGCFSAQDAALLDPYTDDPTNKGILFYSDDAVNRFVRKSNRANLQIALHTIGDAAIEQALNAFELSLKDFPRQDHRHTIIHACLLSDKNIERCARLGVDITLQPGFLGSELEPLDFLEKILGDRVKGSSPFKKAIEAGVHVSGGSDAPVTHPDPIEGIYYACNHPYDDSQSISIEQALKMYTWEIARTSFDEKDRGSLEEGKIADMVILSQNPTTMDRKKLKEIQVEQLYLSGKPFQAGMGIGSLLVQTGSRKKVKI